MTKEELTIDDISVISSMTNKKMIEMADDFEAIAAECEDAEEVELAEQYTEAAKALRERAQ